MSMNINIHVDCDPLWVYASEYGASPDYEDASIYERSLPELLEMLEKRNLRATFFVIGRDLELRTCRAFCRLVLDRGHQIGNHSYSHLPDVHKLTHAERRLEILNCHNAVQQSLGYKCTGLRMPGYYFDDNIAEILGELGYAYDSSVLPGLGIYMMGLFYGLFNRAGKNKRFGRNWYLFASHSPYRVNVGDAGEFIWEAPIFICPLLLLPVHSTFVFQWGLLYLRLALQLARARRQRHLVYLFHAVDLLPGDRAGQLAETVAVLHSPIEQRRAIVGTALDWLAREDVTLTEEWIAATNS